MTAVKLAGCGLLALAGALLGWSRTAALRRQQTLLRSLCQSLGLMRDELTALSPPLPEIFRLLRDRPFFELLWAGFGLEPTQALWRRAAEALELSREDRETLAALGAVVGRYDARRQAAELDLVRRRLADRADALETELAGRAGSFAGLGASLGAILAVLLF